MATTQTATAPTSKGLEDLRQLFADAPDLAKVALENVLRDTPRIEPGLPQTAGRIGSRQGKVSELTVIAPFAKGGAKRLRGLLQSLGGKFDGADRVGSVHDMRFVFLDNDTRLLFATAYDGDWDPYISDFATKIPDEMDLVFTCFEGWPGIRSPSVKDWTAKHQIAAEGWYVANPNLTVVDTRRLQRIGEAVDEFLDKLEK